MHNESRLLRRSRFFYNEIRKEREEGDTMKAHGVLAIAICLLLCLTGCADREQIKTTSSGESPPSGNTGLLDRADSQEEPDSFAPADQMAEPFTTSTSIQDVIDNSVFAGYGRLLFPVEDWYMSGSTLRDLQLTWYNNIDPEETVEIVNTLWQRANAGENCFLRHLYGGRESGRSCKRGYRIVLFPR